MTEAALSHHYRDYIACLNGRDWDSLKQFVSDDARHNGRPFGLAGYRAMLERDFSEISDLRFNIELMVCEAPYVGLEAMRDGELFVDLRFGFAQRPAVFQSGETLGPLAAHSFEANRARGVTLFEPLKVPVLFTKFEDDPAWP